jgi:hypothetical protein
MIDLGINAGNSGNNWISYKPMDDMWTYSEGEMDLKVFVLDYESMKAGWGKISMGKAPQWVWDEPLGVVGKNPGATPEEQDEWSRGMSVELYVLDKEKGIDDVLTWASTGIGANQGLNIIFQEIDKLRKDNPGLSPVLKYTGSEKTTYRTRIPQFEILKWIEKPLAFTKAAEVSTPETDEDDVPF